MTQTPLEDSLPPAQLEPLDEAVLLAQGLDTMHAVSQLQEATRLLEELHERYPTDANVLRRFNNTKAELARARVVLKRVTSTTGDVARLVSFLRKRAAALQAFEEGEQKNAATRILAQVLMRRLKGEAAYRIRLWHDARPSIPNLES